MTHDTNNAPACPLVVMDEVTNNILNPNGGSYVDQMEEARAAVAELVEAAKGVIEMENEPRFLYGEISALRAALAKFGGA